MTDRSEMFERMKGLIEPFNKKGVEVTETTTFAGDLEWDSLTVMDFVAEVEDVVRYCHQHEHAGRDRKCRPAGRCG